MKFEVTHPKIWKKLAEKNIPMKHKVQIYEKLGGAYRLGEDGGEQVFNKMTELLRNKMNEGDEKTPEEVVSGLEEMTMGDLERIADYANMIETRMKEGQQLSSWMYSQLTIALENLNSVHDAMDGNDGEREPMKEASYNVKADNAYQFINGATAVLGVYLRDEKLESGVKNTLQRVVKDLEGLRKYFFSRKDESVNEGRYDADLDKIEGAVKNASSFMSVGTELKKIGVKYDFTTSMMPMYMIKVSGNTIAIVNKKYAADAERIVGDIAIGLLN